MHTVKADPGKNRLYVVLDGSFSAEEMGLLGSEHYVNQRRRQHHALFQVAINHCRNRYKRLKNRGYFSSHSIDDPDTSIQLSSGDYPEKDLERNNMINLVRSEIAAMAPAEKEILLLRDIQELSYEEISAVLNVPLGTVKSKLNRARSTLKNRLQKIL